MDATCAKAEAPIPDNVFWFWGDRRRAHGSKLLRQRPEVRPAHARVRSKGALMGTQNPTKQSKVPSSAPVLRFHRRTS
jgi:hypothetical protein